MSRFGFQGTSAANTPESKQIPDKHYREQCVWPLSFLSNELHSPRLWFCLFPVCLSVRLSVVGLSGCLAVLSVLFVLSVLSALSVLTVLSAVLSVCLVCLCLPLCLSVSVPVSCVLSCPVLSCVSVSLSLSLSLSLPLLSQFQMWYPYSGPAPQVMAGCRSPARLSLTKSLVAVHSRRFRGAAQLACSTAECSSSPATVLPKLAPNHLHIIMLLISHYLMFCLYVHTQARTHTRTKPVEVPEQDSL